VAGYDLMSKRVVILGGGFGGLMAAKALDHPGLEVTLVDRQNHHLFQPLLYQVATAGLSAPEIAQPLRSILARQKNVTCLMDEVSAIDVAARTVTCRVNTLAYDYLIIALGARTSYFGNDAWGEHAMGLKSLDDALEIRRNILLGYEQAENETDPAMQAKLLTTVVVGGGPTGVELAGAFAELSRHVLKRDFRRIDPRAARVILIEAAPRILSTFPESLSENAAKELKRLGVDVRVNCKVEEVGHERLRAGGREIAAANLVWAAGVAASPLTKDLGVPLDRAGRVLVEPDCSLPGHPEVFAIGDMCSLKDVTGKVVPGVCPAAMQMGGHVGRVIYDEAIKDAVVRKPFKYFDKGSMATIGRSAAVAVLGPLKFHGLIAWLLWLFVHLMFLIGFRSKIAVLIDWAYAYIIYRPGARIIMGHAREA
jgi:NADH dehydrogenase